LFLQDTAVPHNATFMNQKLARFLLWSSQTPGLITKFGPIWTTISFLTPRNTSREDNFKHWEGHIRCRQVVCSTTKIICLGWVKEVRTMKP
jgi:hypothetical protein